MRGCAVLAALASAACTDAGSDPNAVVAVRFEGSAYPSIVAGDSLRDSLGALLPLRATGLNYRSEPVEGAPFVFSSPDTILQVFADGVVFARGLKTDAVPARVFATSGTLQSQPDTLFTVPRADSLKAEKTDPSAFINTLLAEAVTPLDSVVPFVVLGDTAAGKPKTPIQGWLVSFQLRYKGVLLPPTDTTKAYTFVNVGGTSQNARRISTFVDTTDASGRVGRLVVLRGISTGVASDTIFLVATARARKANTPPITAETMIIVRPLPPRP
jgi:hypothetical protein